MLLTALGQNLGKVTRSMKDRKDGHRVSIAFAVEGAQ
jgi:hypothetical protein